MKFAVCVTLEVSSDQMVDFLKQMIRNAEVSLATEEGCMQFDVCTDKDSPNVVFLYEVYETPEAFKAHLQTQHFKEFDTKTSGMIINKSIKTFRAVQ